MLVSRAFWTFLGCHGGPPAPVAEGAGSPAGPEVDELDTRGNRGWHKVPADGHCIPLLLSLSGMGVWMLGPCIGLGIETPKCRCLRPSPQVVSKILISRGCLCLPRTGPCALSFSSDTSGGLKATHKPRDKQWDWAEREEKGDTDSVWGWEGLTGNNGYICLPLLVPPAAFSTRAAAGMGSVGSSAEITWKHRHAGQGRG